MKKLIPFPQTSFAEIFQSNIIKFAFVKETPTEFVQQHGLVNCRDFLADVLHAEDIKQKFTIYKFSWDPKKEKVDRDATKLLMSFHTQDQLKTLKRNLHQLHAYEKQWKLRKTKIITISNKEAIIIGSRFYLKKGFGISLYTFLLKAFAIADSMQTLTGNEREYLVRCDGYFQKLLANFRKVLAYKASVCGVTDDSLYNIHNYAGFVGVCAHPSYQAHSEYLRKLP